MKKARKNTFNPNKILQPIASTWRNCPAAPPGSVPARMPVSWCACEYSSVAPVFAMNGVARNAYRYMAWLGA